MHHLRIAIGFTTDHRDMASAEVIAFGPDPVKLQAAIDSADPKFKRFELGVFHFQRKALRRAKPITITTPSIQPVPSPESPGEGPEGSDSSDPQPLADLNFDPPKPRKR